MEIFIYTLIFIMGAFIGSFSSLAVYRIPIGQDIFFKRSYCPNCNHELNLKDLFPIFSYIFLRGKCRYCFKPVRVRYLLLELSSGFIFLFFALSLNIHIYNIEYIKMGLLVFGFLYIIGLILIAGIDKERINIQKSVLIYELIVIALYIVYLYILKFNIHRYVIYLIIMFILIFIDTILLKKQEKSNYIIQILMLCIIIIAFSGIDVFVYSVVLTLFLIFVSLILRRVQKDENRSISLPIGFYLCITNIIVLIIQNILMFC